MKRVRLVCDGTWQGEHYRAGELVHPDAARAIHLLNNIFNGGKK